MKRRNGFFALLVWLPLLAGCGGPDNVAKVSGKVMLAGEPLGGALVEFAPVGAGSPSRARTDESGNYELKYTRDTKGALVGEHQVRISTYVPADKESDPPVEGVLEKVPAKYNIKTELNRKVEKGSNTIDFELEAGEVISPEAMGRNAE